MGSLKFPPDKVLPVGAVMLTDPGNLDAVTEAVASHFDGNIFLSDGFWVQDFTHYYDEQMTGNLQKYFYYIDRLISPENAHQWKLWSNNSERSYSNLWEEKRPVNIDPGYLTLSKLILLSTKDFSHRIYLRDGVYAEVTLQYSRKQFRALPWSYPDYQTEMAFMFWEAAREMLKKLSGNP